MARVLPEGVGVTGDCAQMRRCCCHHRPSHLCFDRRCAVDVEIRTPAEIAGDFRRSLDRFLDSHTFPNDEGFTIHWSEPMGAEVIHHISFETAEVAEAFQTSWRCDANERE